MYKKLFLTVVLCVIGVFARPASVSYTNFVATTFTDWTNTVPLTQFNPSYGTLQSVQLSVTTGLSTILSLTNNVSSSSSGFATTLFQVYFGTNYGLTGTGSSTNPVINTITPLYSYNLPGMTGLVTGNIQATASDIGPVFTNAITLNAFTGTGYVDITASTFTIAGVFNLGGNTTVSQTTTAGLTTVITYNFLSTPIEPLPEPSTFVLMGAGLTGIGMFWRRRSAK